MSEIVARYIKIPQEGFNTKLDPSSQGHITLANAIKQTQINEKNEKQKLDTKQAQGDGFIRAGNNLV